MRPGSIDEVIAAYTTALANRQAARDRLRGALEHVDRLRKYEAEQTDIGRALRAEVQSYTDAQASGEVAA